MCYNITGIFKITTESIFGGKKEWNLCIVAANKRNYAPRSSVLFIEFAAQSCEYVFSTVATSVYPSALCALLTTGGTGDREP
jgi:hypothetical protein